MPAFVAVVVLPLMMVAGGIALALTRSDPMWLVYGAVLGIATSHLARKDSGR